MYFHCGNNNSATNNLILAPQRQSVGAFSGGGAVGGCDNVGRGFSTTFMRNVLLLTNTVNAQQLNHHFSGPGSDNITWDKNVYWITPARASNATAALRFEGGGGLAAWRGIGQDLHSIVADPMLVDAGALNASGHSYDLQPSSAAWAMGFTTIDLSTVGRIVAVPSASASPPPVVPSAGPLVGSASTVATSTRSPANVPTASGVATSVAPSQSGTASSLTATAASTHAPLSASSSGLATAAVSSTLSPTATAAVSSAAVSASTGASAVASTVSGSASTASPSQPVVIADVASVTLYASLQLSGLRALDSSTGDAVNARLLAAFGSWSASLLPGRSLRLMLFCLVRAAVPVLRFGSVQASSMTLASGYHLSFSTTDGINADISEPTSSECARYTMAAARSLFQPLMQQNTFPTARLGLQATDSHVDPVIGRALSGAGADAIFNLSLTVANATLAGSQDLVSLLGAALSASTALSAAVMQPAGALIFSAGPLLLQLRMASELDTSVAAVSVSDLSAVPPLATVMAAQSMAVAEMQAGFDARRIADASASLAVSAGAAAGAAALVLLIGVLVFLGMRNRRKSAVLSAHSHRRRSSAALRGKGPLAANVVAVTANSDGGAETVFTSELATRRVDLQHTGGRVACDDSTDGSRCHRVTAEW